MKTCSSCKEEKLLSEFSKDRSRKDGFTYRCKTCCRLSFSKWQRANPEKQRERKDKYSAKNPGWQNKANVRYRKNNLEKERARYAAWALKNKEKRRTINRRRTAKMRGAYVEDIDVFFVAERDKWVCQLCFDPVDPQVEGRHPLAKSVDHILPISLGGEDSYSNVQLAHFSCNSRKRDRVAKNG